MALSASGAITISVGPKGDYSGAAIATAGNFTMDASNATSGSITLGNISAVGAAAISMGSGSGTLAVTNFESLKTITIDGTKFGGTMDVTRITSSGAVVVSVGGNGDFSAAEVHTQGTITLDVQPQQVVRYHLERFQQLELLQCHWVAVLGLSRSQRQYYLL